MVNRTNMIYVPNLGYTGLTRQTKGKMRGAGASVLLKSGGPGAGSSYDSVDEYIATTSRNPLMTGSGSCNSQLSKKLESLSLAVKPPKKISKNIRFNL